MFCPFCKKIELEKAIFNNVEVDYCPSCLGVWFEEEELRWAKDARDENLKWLDMDLWEKEKDFKISRGQKLCPDCRLPLYEVVYGESQVKVDLCSICRGVWLDKGEFQKIIEYLKERAGAEVMQRFSKNAAKEFSEIFAGPESLREEMDDFIVLLKVFAYRFYAKHPVIAKIISGLPE
ncbi:MAG: hypothetical protein A2667_00115 [Candidatus Wildermuthbacteria bacterium RIFCSPHIGHO2_01_FULL_47_27]|uniref:Transcription factor zinc-finger domain-containing protein n=2 Tax=Candidatus Wildermuthiibacteriota TaxID=1817923 RepID=A0A1G2RQT4_9BACT|nr:MAG: hypothetical protein UY15_C0011G0007 [Parcubacteria group bacterium GW2011_GWA2_47_9]OHA64595.1 MAG: hypothetical protein A2667_00115 [Candidatus Wildermuthbacteria bacterium RIFCSPHIGHO2_01_FULL_47_27]OHA68906.1 MAG: hypothetical protein A3D59_00390 [Candidatus Wildermuthbacteria bacterium RIFCSPHIGHO2_02_FULL_47_17]OHA75206.1 MAG: hypothetical protein A3A32_02650 [Candidatus Wildermuthbacteria bacterium RIFCSPLOWO2_01_FULL_48_35]OHA75421.1 MAG: hypothetical protein A3I38_01900 [Candid